MKLHRHKKVALVLGSGAARGWAHLGVIRALEELEIPIHCVVGTSIGALVGGSFASSRHPILQDVALRLDWRQLLYMFLDVTFPRTGLIDGARVEAFVRGHVQQSRIEDLPIEFRAVATDILTGRKVVLERGDLVEAIRASLSVAVIFSPVCRDGAVLVDGGLVDPLPVSVARELGADYVIASEVNLLAFDARLKGSLARREDRSENGEMPREPSTIRGELLDRVADMRKKWKPGRLPFARQWLEREALPSIFEVVTSAYHILEAQVTLSRLAAWPADLLIQPPVARLNNTDYHRAGVAIKAGYAEALKQLRGLSAGALRRLRQRK